MSGSLGTYVCANRLCGCEFQARTADRARGWARFCSKRCKAVKQEMQTGQFRALQERRGSDDPFGDAEHMEDGSWDAHKGVF